ncbi:hypothetical protein ACEPAH_3443 [Sanghuangporus vaninii]
MRIIIIAVSAIVALASSVHAAPWPYSFELNERRDRGASGHHKRDDTPVSIASVTVFTASPEVGPFQNNIEYRFVLTILTIIGNYKDIETSTSSTAGTVTVFAADPSATNSVSPPANTAGTISDLIASLGLNESTPAVDLLSSLKASNLTLPSNPIVSNVGNTNIQDPESAVSEANGGSANGGKNGNCGNGVDASAFAGDFDHFVNGNEISGGEFNGTTIDASNPAS